MSNFTHPVKPGRIAIVNFSDSRQTEIHALGCRHTLKGNHVHEVPAGEEPTPTDGYADDWYKVAPCARA